MSTTPRELLDTSIAQLEMLAAFLDEQLGAGSGKSKHITTETCACDEILASLRVLIRRVHRRHGLHDQYC